MAKAWMEDKWTWLFDLAHGNLDSDAVLKGFLKHYAIQDKGIGDVQGDLHFKTPYGDRYMSDAMRNLTGALEDQIKT